MLKNIQGRFNNEAALIFLRSHFLDLIIFFSLFFFQLVFRFYRPDIHGAWDDEVATLFFSTNLEVVFNRDSHSLFYYLFVSPISLLDPLNFVQARILHGVLNLGLTILIMWRSRLVFTEGQWLFFNSIYGLHPLVFGMSRLFRTYGPLIDLTTLLIIECKLYQSKRRIFLVSMLQTAFYPLMVIPLMIETLFHHRKKEISKVFFFASLPCLIYYFAKIVFDQGRFNYILWIDSSYLKFFNDLTDLLAGSFVPFYRSLDYGSGKFILAIIFAGMLLSAFFFKLQEGKKGILKFVTTFGIVYFGINFTSLFLDLRISRYYVFLLPYFLFALTYSIPPRKTILQGMTVLFAGIILYQVIFREPFFQERAAFGDLINEVKSEAITRQIPVMGCGYIFHDWYFKMHGFSVCTDVKDIQKFKKLNGQFIYAFIDKQTQGLDELGEKVIVKAYRAPRGRYFILEGKNE